MRRIWSLMLLFAMAMPASAYTIYMNDGSRLMAEKKYEVDGERAIITLTSGARTFVALSEIDIPRTEEANKDGYGTALVLESGSVQQQAVGPPEPDRSMAEVAAETRQRNPTPRTPSRQQSPPLAERSGASDTGVLSSGARDLANLPRVEYPDGQIVRTLRRRFGERGLEELQILRGRQPDRLRLQATTDSEAAVFRAIALSAGSLLGLAESDAGSELTAIELLLETSSGERAGQFVISLEDARQLVEEEVSLPEFYVQNVQF